MDPTASPHTCQGHERPRAAPAESIGPAAVAAAAAAYLLLGDPMGKRTSSVCLFACSAKKSGQDKCQIGRVTCNVSFFVVVFFHQEQNKAVIFFCELKKLLGHRAVLSESCRFTLCKQQLCPGRECRDIRRRACTCQNGCSTCSTASASFGELA